MTIQHLFSRIIPYIAWIHPNVITMASLLFSVLFFVAIVFHVFTIALLLLFGTVADALDGAVARYANKTSPFGALLDATVDRISDAILISSFSFASLVRWEITIPLLVTTFLISYIRARGEFLFHLNMEGIGFMERTERLIGIGIAVVTAIISTKKIYTLSLPEWVFLAILFLSVVTCVQRMHLLWKKTV